MKTRKAWWLEREHDGASGIPVVSGSWSGEHGCVHFVKIYWVPHLWFLPFPNYYFIKIFKKFKNVRKTNLNFITVSNAKKSKDREHLTVLECIYFILKQKLEWTPWEMGYWKDDAQGNKAGRYWQWGGDFWTTSRQGVQPTSRKTIQRQALKIAAWSPSDTSLPCTNTMTGPSETPVMLQRLRFCHLQVLWPWAGLLILPASPGLHL